VKVVVGDEIAAWLERQFNTKFHPPFIAMGFMADDGRGLCAALWNDYTPGGSIELTVAAGEKGGLTRGVIRYLCHYAFVTNRCRRIQVHVRKSNKTLLRRLPDYGFKYETVAPCFYADEDAVVFRMLFSDQPWIKLDEVQPEPLAA
jgi:hypothetical protein